MAQISFNSNASSLRVQRELTSTGRSVGTSYERLATGLRINRASDDAAGLAIADQLKTNSRLYSTASKNINDGISSLNIIDGALEQQSNAVQRLIELAQQASNGSLSTAQRNSLSSEYRALVKEVSRVGDTTTFNGLNLLKGARGNISQLLLQAGITGSSTSRLGINTVDTSTLSGKVDLSGITSDLSNSKYQSTATLIAAYNGVVMRATATTAQGTSAEVLIGFTYTTADPYDTDESLIDFHIFGPGTGNAQWQLETSGQISYFTATGNVENDDVFSNLDQQHLSFSFNGSPADITLDFRGLTFVGQTAGGKPGALSAAGTALEFSGLETQTASQSALTYAKARLTQLSSSRGDIGAVASRLISALSLSQVNEESTRSAEQRIRDVDVAEEAAKLTSNQIRQRSASQVLALANQQPGLLLSLLQSPRSGA